MFDPDLNPYVKELDKYRDIIIATANQDRSTPVRQIGRHSSRPMIVDLGCGAGNFLRDYALVKPDSDFYGFELRYKRLVKGAIKFRKRKLNNIKLIQAKAEDVGQWFEPDSISEIYVNFPDPWPKKRHQKHRLITADFVSVLRDLLQDDGIFVFKTDHSEYFYPVVDLIRGNSILDIVEYSENLHESAFNDSNICTEFELLFKNKGYPVYYMKCKLR